MTPIIYISKRCSHCRKLLLLLQERPQLKGHYKIVSIDDSPFPQIVKSVPCMIVDDQLIGATDLFNYIISSDEEQKRPQQNVNRQNMQQRKPQQDHQSCSVNELDGVCPTGNCLDFAPIDDNMNISNDSFSYIDEPGQPQLNHTNKSDAGSEKRQAFDNDYEKLMAERGEMMAKPSFA
tara:strand:- start:1621 stop:2154 length:534 start_codon:yes stop_codon:yes gene_type:complete